ncbi:uncharacterized shell protein 6-like [Saccostrea echinata]|uniref:uncharacterized shell protein 6-like n=1 Tax=Saccostrea echinata TaxID=191078 RepID=UPI002A8347D9|nr:uncharacterized shell protein 6-like [Saccostrea echinata]
MTSSMRCVFDILFVVVTLFYLVVLPTECCQCSNATREERYCDSDFSLVGMPVGKFLSDDKVSIVHVIRVRMLNHLPPSESPRYVELESPINVTGCGVQLEAGQEYVFNAIFRPEINEIRGRITKCGWNEKWALVPNFIKIPLLGDTIICPQLLDPVDYHI